MELLVVISVIAVLAALTFPAIRAAKISVLRQRARGELTQLASAIDRYQQKLGYYPPDSPTSPNWAINQLYYELLGATNVTIAGVPYYQTLTLDVSAQIRVADLATVFGPGVTGFMNCARPRSGEELPTGLPFLRGLKPSQYLAFTNGGSATPVATVLGTSIEGPLMLQDAAGIKINPWRYNSSSPRYNPKTYDLWVDVTAGDKTNRICNWSEKPLVVGAPY